MKSCVKLTHRLIYNIGLDNLISYLSGKLPAIWRLIPTNLEYPEYSKKRIRRDGVIFEIWPRDYMQWHVFANVPEPLWSRAWKYLDSNPVIFDIGANIGAFSLKTAAYLHRRGWQFNIYAIEPNPTILALLNRNCRLNPRISKQILTEEFAFSNEKGEMNFVSFGTNSGAGKLTDEDLGVSVKLRTLDSYVFEQKITKVDFVKIDVEGFEPRVLAGAQEVIKKHKPILILEITDEWYRSIGSSATEVLHYLEKLRYRFFSDVTGKVLPFNIKAESQLPFQYNVLAINEEKTR